ncbi:hypothetical protein ACP70R_035095 [Stipagrostis hirtigluma subsp. patula]
MTIGSLGTAANGGGGGSGPRSSVLAPPKKRKITLDKSGGFQGACAGAVMDAADQERAWNSECPGDRRQESAQAPALPPPTPRAQEPVKRGRSANGEEISWATKKQRSAVAAAISRGNVIAEMNRAAAAATSSPIVQEPAVNWDGVERIFRRSPEGSAGEPLDERKEEKVRPCELAAPVHGLEGLFQEPKVAVLDLSLPLPMAPNTTKRDRDTNGENLCWLPKKHCRALCKQRNCAVDQVNTALPSITSPGSQKVRRRLPAKAAGGKRRTSNHSDRKTTNQPSMSLSSRLQCLGVSKVTPVLTKSLTCSDCDLSQARLLVTLSMAMDSPLNSMLTPYERRAVHRKDDWDGLPLEALDRHGRSYDMTYKYLCCNTAFRFIGEWGKFVTQNGVRSGDLVELGAFRVDGILALTLLHHAKQLTPEEVMAEAVAVEERTPKGIEEAEGAKVELTPEVKKAGEDAKEKWTPEEKKEAVEGAKEWTPQEKESAEGAEVQWTPDEIEAAEGLIQLSNFRGRTKSDPVRNNASQVLKRINSWSAFRG